ncbi:heavy metal translocating P-type ATPase [Undibacterium sp. SXout7W]|uniref:heavy metal translocating P-type ATPase n=1 Tax=Undibacterium sp. SXout7W TaxID=3413049 RepID=UPI003BF3A3D3
MHSNEMISGITQAQNEPSTQEQERLYLSGMHCAACVQLIEFRLRQLPGVIKFTINVTSHRADVIWQSDKTSLKKILDAIVSLGYGALPSNQSPDEFEKKENKLALWRLFVAGFAMMQIMMYAFPAYLVPVPQPDGDLTPDLDKLLKLASMIIAIPVIGFSATPFFKSAWRDVRNRHVGMDVPVSLGILLTFFASVWATFHGGTVYFDSAIMFVFLLLGARYIESRVQKKTTAALRILTQLTPAMAQKISGYPDHRQMQVVDASVLMPGDILLVNAGESFPADGIVLEGTSECDESLMTGESLPVSKSVGSEVIAGAVNITGTLVVRALHVAGQTQLSALIGMMESAAAEKPPLVLLADKHASRFLVLILLIAFMSVVVWMQIDSSRALWIGISIIVVTCPCALSLATPGVMSAAIGLLAKNGVLITNGKVIQAMASATHFVFDKTGTLTVGKLRVVEMRHVVKNASHDVAEHLAFTLASYSSHPVSKAIADALSVNHSGLIAEEIAEINEMPGRGVEVRYDGKFYRLGNIDFVCEHHSSKLMISPDFANKTVSAIGDREQIFILFALEDVLRADAKEAIQHLMANGKQVLLLSGDRREVVQKIADECHITQAIGELSPQGKFEIVKKLQSTGASVVMVGDGMNDGPVLSLADVAVAMGQGAPISQSRSDLLLMSNRLTDLNFGFAVATKAFRLIRENLAWAVLYNALAIPAAVMGLLEPWHAALGMSLSSLIVVLNALRLYLITPPVHLMAE